MQVQIEMNRRQLRILINDLKKDRGNFMSVNTELPEEKRKNLRMGLIEVLEDQLMKVNE